MKKQLSFTGGRINQRGASLGQDRIMQLLAGKDADSCKKDCVNISKRFQKNVKIYTRPVPSSNMGGR